EPEDTRRPTRSRPHSLKKHVRPIRGLGHSNLRALCKCAACHEQPDAYRCHCRKPIALHEYSSWVMLVRTLIRVLRYEADRLGRSICAYNQIRGNLIPILDP